MLSDAHILEQTWYFSVVANIIDCFGNQIVIDTADLLYTIQFDTVKSKYNINFGSSCNLICQIGHAINILAYVLWCWNKMYQCRLHDRFDI